MSTKQSKDQTEHNVKCQRYDNGSFYFYTVLKYNKGQISKENK